MRLAKNSDSNGDHLIAGDFLSRHWGALYTAIKESVPLTMDRAVIDRVGSND